MITIDQRKTFQRLKQMTNEHFWREMDAIHEEAYKLGQKHMMEAMGCIKGITKKQIEAVEAKADKICAEWDGIIILNAERVEVNENKDN